MTNAKWRPSEHFLQVREQLTHGGALGDGAVQTLKLLAATEVATSERPQELNALYEGYFRDLATVDGSAPFATYGARAVSVAEQRLRDPSLATVKVRDVAQFNEPAAAALHFIGLICDPDLSSAELEAELGLRVDDELRGAIRSWWTGSLDSALYNPERIGDQVTFTSWATDWDFQFALKHRNGHWRLMAVTHDAASGPVSESIWRHGGPGDYLVRYEPPMQANVFDESGSPTRRGIAEVVTFRDIGGRAVSADPQDVRIVRQYEVRFEDGSPATLYEIGAPRWRRYADGFEFVPVEADFTTVKPILDRTIFY